MDGFRSTRSHKIETTDGHQLYVEESGSQIGIPALFLHGGPGAGIGQYYQGIFAEHEYRLIAFDQRGCGRSQPFADLSSNNTQSLVEDIELIREYFGIEKWLLFGGSWGSTLALVYAIKHPNRVSAMILRGIFLGRKEDADWFLSPAGGAAQVYPVHYQQFTHGINNSDSRSICEAYFAQLTDSNDEIKNKAAVRWFNWEGSISKLKLSEHEASEFANNQQIYTLALMECFYLLNYCFIDENMILNQADTIKHIPTHIVHGRYDMVCKTEAAVKLHEHMPLSTLNIVPDAGHSMNEKGISKALTKSLHFFAIKLKK